MRFGAGRGSLKPLQSKKKKNKTIRGEKAGLEKERSTERMEEKSRGRVAWLKELQAFLFRDAVEV